VGMGVGMSQSLDQWLADQAHASGRWQPNHRQPPQQAAGQASAWSVQQLQAGPETGPAQPMPSSSSMQQAAYVLQAPQEALWPHPHPPQAQAQAWPAHSWAPAVQQGPGNSGNTPQLEAPYFMPAIHFGHTHAAVAPAAPAPTSPSLLEGLPTDAPALTAEVIRLRRLVSFCKAGGWAGWGIQNAQRSALHGTALHWAMRTCE
jgi:hypothetical protein